MPLWSAMEIHLWVTVTLSMLTVQDAKINHMDLRYTTNENRLPTPLLKYQYVHTCVFLYIYEHFIPLLPYFDYLLLSTFLHTCA